jgi:hypothetical protein
MSRHCSSDELTQVTDAKHHIGQKCQDIVVLHLFFTLAYILLYASLSMDLAVETSAFVMLLLLFLASLRLLKVTL